MAKYGGLTGPGSYGFPGWPSKVHGAASGDGRYNALGNQAVIVGSGFGQQFPKGLPHRNEIKDGRWLLPNYLRIPAKGSKVAKSLLYSFPEIRGTKYTDFLELTVECLNEPHRDWSNGGSAFFPFELVYMIAKSDEPGAAYDQLIHFNTSMPYVEASITKLYYPEDFVHWLPGAPASSAPDPRIMDENYITDGKPTLDTCQISVAGATNLRAILFAHWDAGDGLYIVEKSGNLVGYNAFEIPFFLIQLMAYSDQPGAFCEKHIHRRFPPNNSVHILPKKLQELYPGIWP